MKYIKTDRGLLPLSDYLDIKALSCGYDDYDEMKADGLSIQINEDDVVEKDTVEK